MDSKFMYKAKACLIVLLTACCWSSCQGDGDYAGDQGKDVITEGPDTSVVWRVKTHTYGHGVYSPTHCGFMAIALENGVRLAVNYPIKDILKDYVLVEKGDTVIYGNDSIISVKFHRE